MDEKRWILSWVMKLPKDNSSGKPFILPIENGFEPTLQQTMLKTKKLLGK